MYERFLHALNMGVTCVNNDMVRELVSNADAWSYSHRKGEFCTDRQRQQMVNSVFWRLCDTPEADAEWENRMKKIKEAKENA